MKNFDDCMPEASENRLQQPSCGHVPGQSPQGHGQQSGKTQVPLANAEHQHQPSLEGCQDKQQV